MMFLIAQNPKAQDDCFRAVYLAFDSAISIFGSLPLKMLPCPCMYR